jgi:hypothetical protein
MRQVFTIYDRATIQTPTMMTAMPVRRIGVTASPNRY